MRNKDRCATVELEDIMLEASVVIAQTSYVPPVHFHILSNLIGNNGFIYLIVCPVCMTVNSPVGTSVGRCANCGYDVNHDEVE